MDFGWVATVDEETLMSTSWEFTGVCVTRDNSGPVLGDVWNVTGNLMEDTDIDWTQVGADTVPGQIADAAAVTAWTVGAEVVTGDGNITGLTMSGTRPFTPTAEAASALTLYNQVPNYLCASIWTTETSGVSGSAEAGCALVTINIPVPEPEPVEEPTGPVTTGAFALKTTALAVAAIAVMAF